MKKLMAIILVLSSTMAMAEVYKWVDENGVTHYGSKKPPIVEAEVINVRSGSVTKVAGSDTREFAESAKKEGHLSQFSVISQELTKCGHEVFFAARDLSRSHAFFPNQQVRLLQSPVWQPKLRKPMRTRTFSEILLYQGFQSRDALQPLVNAWRNLFALTAPDIVLLIILPLPWWLQ